jgi:flagellar biosynthesis protein FlhB
MDFEAIKLQLALVLVGSILLATVWLFYKNLTRNNAESARRVAGPVYRLMRGLIALILISLLMVLIAGLRL